jgi:hypothetical protein
MGDPSGEYDGDIKEHVGVVSLEKLSEFESLWLSLLLCIELSVSFMIAFEIRILVAFILLSSK